MADELRIGADGFVDVDALPDVDPELALEPDALLSLREALLGSPVPEPDAATWSGIVDGALADDAADDDLGDLVPEQDEAGPFDAAFAGDDLDDDLDLDADLDDDLDAAGTNAFDDDDLDLDGDLDLGDVPAAAFDDAPLELAVEAGDDGFDLGTVDDDLDAGIADDELESPSHVDGIDDHGSGS